MKKQAADYYHTVKKASCSRYCVGLYLNFLSARGPVFTLI